MAAPRAGGVERVGRFLRSCGLSADSEIGFVVDQGDEPTPQQGIHIDNKDAPLPRRPPSRALGHWFGMSSLGGVLPITRPPRIGVDHYFRMGVSPSLLLTVSAHGAKRARRS